MAYFNETGPIYQQELVQVNEFSKFVHSYVVVANKSLEGSPNPKNDSVWFDWEGFRVAVASSEDLSFEHEVCVLVPSHSVDSPESTLISRPMLSARTNGNDTTDTTTVQAVLDALVARFASLFAHALFIPASETTIVTDSGYGADVVPRTRAQRQAYFFDVFRRNLYCAFTRHLGATDAREHYLSMQRCSHLDINVGARSAWEYRLLFVQSDAQSGTRKGLVVTVTLEGNFEDEIRRTRPNEKESEDGTDRDDDEEDEVWYGVSLDSKGPFSGALRAMQVTFKDGFRCP